MSAARQMASLSRPGKPAFWPRWLTPLRVFCAALLVTFVAGYFWGRQLEQQRRYQAWQEEQRVRHVLQLPVKIVLPQSQGSTLQEAVTQLRRQVRVPIALDSSIAHDK